MTALSNATSLPTSFVEYVETRVTWPEIVPTDREVPIGAMMLLAAHQVVDPLVGRSVQAMRWTGSTRYVKLRPHFCSFR